jgi:NAD(P)-dependent dehydrogenase (short-subunit alcohol dehydrogenase family)
MRLTNKIAIVVGAGQSPGEGLGNGHATVLRFAREGAKVLAVDNNLSSAEETVAIARQARGECVAGLCSAEHRPRQRQRIIL